MKNVLIKMSIVVFAAYLVGAFMFSLWPFSIIKGVTSKVAQPTAIVQNYEWFHDQYNAILAQRENVKVLSEGKEKTGALMVLNRAIGEYNSRSNQISRNLWKSGDLPHRITMEGLK